ncbi:alpha/beta fold hydrolase [Flavobacterium sp. SM15]|uniref:alpha/beta fold hydrolase n=1 Tax=Flavobacterium sp. SM15 TaxID=2908005 RepID=UPI001ED9D3EE|nr:alpha/beta fold hydrolase [Flavobacterium sp. SM15]MCG2610793.1 alpha/beta fold hydrolase [Flavobacterium sp. SM15]
MELYSRIEGEGKPLLIVHGFLGMSDNWKSLAAQFAVQGFQVHALDMRNHGKSPHSEEFTYEAMAQDVLEYCEVHRLKNICLLGHSMGGKIAMLLATTHPDLVEKLIVADIGPKYYPPHHQKILEGLNAVDFSLQPSRAEVEEVLSQYIKDFGTRQFLLKNLYWVEPGQLAFRFNLDVFNRKIETIGNALPFDNRFEKPTLFLRGDKSDYILDSDFETIVHHFPGADIQTIKNSGHWLHAENPIDFMQACLAFLL